MTPSLSDMRDIRPIIALSDPLSILVLLLIILAIIFLGLLVFWWWRKRKTQVEKESPLEPKQTPYEWFVQTMRELKEAKLGVVDHCFQLSFIFRDYVERDHSFPATDRTSEEILRELRKLYLFNDIQLRDLRKVFGIIDPVKYAARKPSSEEVIWVENTLLKLASARQSADGQATAEAEAC